MAIFGSFDAGAVAQLAQLADAAYPDSAPLPPGWTVLSGAALLDPALVALHGGGFDAAGNFINGNAAGLIALHHDPLTGQPDRLALVFRGTDLASGPDNVAADVLDVLFQPEVHYARLLPLVDAAVRYANDHADTIGQVFVTGHSLGAQMAQLFAGMGSAGVGGLALPLSAISIVTFASPGSPPTVQVPPAVAARTLHVHNSQDPVYTHIPPLPFLAALQDVPVLVAALALLAWARVAAYAHPGQEASIDQALVDGFLDPTVQEHRIELHEAAVQDIAASGLAELAPPTVQIVALDETANSFATGFRPQPFVLGLGGDDSIAGAFGIDFLVGGAGQDALEGRGNGDGLSGGDGNDTLDGGPGADTLLGGAGDDLLQGGGGNDLLAGGDGSDTLEGGNGNDTLTGDAFDRFDGGAGQSDVLRLEGEGAALDFTALDNDRVRGIERIDLGGGGANLVTLDLSDVLDFSDSTNRLIVDGEAGDGITAIGGWQATGTPAMDGVEYQRFALGGATLLVNEAVEATIAAAAQA